MAMTVLGPYDWRAVTADTGARERAAEYALLELYDRRRSRAGHDYGAGQRGAELVRRRRALRLDVSYAPAPSYGDFTRAELRAAYVRVGAPRYRRALTDARRSSLILDRGTDGARTPTARRTLDTWRAMARTCLCNPETGAEL